MRAQFYSVIALLITLPIIIFTVHYLTYSQKLSYGVADRVISDQLHQLGQSIELDTLKALEVSGRRALIATSNYVINSGSGIADAKANLTRLMLKGTLNGTENFMMINNTLPNWSYRISSTPVDFSVDLEYNNLSIRNWDGFNILVSIDLNLTVSDKLGIAKIEKKDLHKSVLVSVANLEDPTFALNSGGFLRRIIKIGPTSYVSKKVVYTSDNRSGSCEGEITFNKSEDDTDKILVTANDTGVNFGYHKGIIMEINKNLSKSGVSCYNTGNSSAVNLINKTVNSSDYYNVYIDHDTRAVWSMPFVAGLEEGYYYKGEGPDFLNRLEGNLSPSNDGFVTFIYAPGLEEQALPVEDRSRVAHLYFNGPSVCWKVRNTPDWFGIDSTYEDKLNLTGLTTGESCYTYTP